LHTRVAKSRYQQATVQGVDIARDGVAERIPGQRDERAQHTTDQPPVGPEPVDTPWRPPAELPPHVSGLRPPPGGAAPEPVDRRRLVAVHSAWALPALLMLGLGLYGLTGASLWGDELLTWGMTETGWSDFQSLTTRFVTPLMPYYLLMRGWTAIVGTSDAALRLPSVLAAAAAVGVVARLGTRLVTPLAGLLAGVLLAVIPAMSRYAQEARPYTMAMFAVALASLALLRYAERPSVWRLVGYGAVVAVIAVLHFIALAVVLAHAVWLAATRRDLLWRWGIAAVAGCLPAVPLVWYGLDQRDAVKWIATSPASLPQAFFSGLFGALSVMAIVAGLALLSLSPRIKPLLLVLWGTVPLAAVYLAGLQLGSVWLPRYLMYVIPAWILLAAMTMVRSTIAGAVAVLALVVVLGVPAHRDMRAEGGHGLAARQAAKIISDGYLPGDAVIYGAQGAGLLTTTRDLVDHYVPADRRPREPLLFRPPRTRGQAGPILCRDVAGCLKNPTRIWIVRLGTPPNPIAGVGPGYDAVLRNYVVQQRWNPKGLTIALLTSNRN
jgi:mannosyltransferase